MARNSYQPNRQTVAQAMATDNFDVRVRVAISGWLTLAVVSILALGLAGCGSSTSRALATAPKPTPELTPEDVVRIQVESLQEGDDRGIATVYQFASPDNRLATGPLGRFSRLFETPSYRSLREAKDIEYFEMEVDGNSAMQIVALTNARGEVSFYLFQLSRQAEGDFNGCWMTDGVAPSVYRMTPSGESITNS